MRLLIIGDIVGEPGRRAVAQIVPRLKRDEKIDLAIGNAENVTNGGGLIPRHAQELYHAGLDVLTMGDHIWDKKEIYQIVSSDPRIVRPANYPKSVPGQWAIVVKTPAGEKVGVTGVLGRVFMKQPYDSPFVAIKEAVDQLRKETPVIVVDVHAETTSEKVALGWYLDGQVSVVFGTHTHIQTADERTLPLGTSYITDVGMVGPYDSVIGRKKEQVLETFLTQVPRRYEVASGDVRLCGAIIDVDSKTGKATAIRRIQERLEDGSNPVPAGKAD